MLWNPVIPSHYNIIYALYANAPPFFFNSKFTFCSQLATVYGTVTVKSVIQPGLKVGWMRPG